MCYTSFDRRHSRFINTSISTNIWVMCCAKSLWQLYCHLAIGILQLQYNLMGPLFCVWFIVNQNIVMLCMTVYTKEVICGCWANWNDHHQFCGLWGSFLTLIHLHRLAIAISQHMTMCHNTYSKGKSSSWDKITRNPYKEYNYYIRK